MITLIFACIVISLLIVQLVFTILIYKRADDTNLWVSDFHRLINDEEDGQTSIMDLFRGSLEMEQKTTYKRN